MNIPNTMKTQTRIQLSRKKGFNLQELSQELNGLTCVRVCRPTKWGNPWAISYNLTAQQAVEGYVAWIGGADWTAWMWIHHRAAVLAIPEHIKSSDMLDYFLEELRGKNLACWCPLVDNDGKPVPCHANILLKLANEQ